MEDLQQVFDDLGIDAKVVDMTEGPTFSRFEVVVGPGTKANKILSLGKHLSYHYGASVNIGSIPGKRAIGIDVSSAHGMVRLFEIMATEPDAISIGKSIDGPVVTSLDDLPHMIVAGATGSGKSVFINSIICELIMKNTPDQLRLAMVDPKRVELTKYNGIPHLMGNVVTEPLQADAILRGLTQEMSRRYDLMNKYGVRHASDIDLPSIVIVIDELADLMMVSGKSVESNIVRIAQLARAASMHLIIATQRPSVDVLTGLIKANLPARLAFCASSMGDSRVVLDANGAEGLLGRGDALYRPAGGSLVRLQAPYVSDLEIDRLVSHWSA